MLANKLRYYIAWYLDFSELPDCIAHPTISVITMWVQESLQLTAGDRLAALETELSLEQDIGLSPRERIGRIEQAIQWSCQKSSPGLIARISSAETQVF